jgi:hypothetical protein
MSASEEYHYLLIRDGAILVRMPRDSESLREPMRLEFFDVRTGVQLRDIHPAFQEIELRRGYPVSPGHAASILNEGAPLGVDLAFDLSNVVSILEVKQRKLDSVVADSILDQVRLISNLLREFLRLADTAEREERFWMSQQVLTLARKFSGRELEELKEDLEWLKSRRKR